MICELEESPGYYIEDTGKVYCTLGRGCRTGAPRVPQYELSPRPGKNGYLRIYVRSVKTGKRKDLYIHRLVAKYFVPNPDNKPIVNHKNFNRSDNTKDNLEWVTSSENNQYSITHGRLCHDVATGRFVSGI